MCSLANQHDVTPLHIAFIHCCALPFNLIIENIMPFDAQAVAIHCHHKGENLTMISCHNGTVSTSCVDIERDVPFMQAVEINNVTCFSIVVDLMVQT